jgi:hypothetical protein
MTCVPDVGRPPPLGANFALSLAPGLTSATCRDPLAGHACRTRKSLPWRLLPGCPAARRRVTIGATVDRPSRQARAQRPSAAAASCSAPMTRTSCSRVSPSTCGHDGASELRPRRGSTDPGRGVGRELVPRGAEHLQRLLQCCERVGRDRVACWRFSCRPEGSRSCDEVGGAGVKSICRVHQHACRLPVAVGSPAPRTAEPAALCGVASLVSARLRRLRGAGMATPQPERAVHGLSR